jgi:hypothetical protein
VAVPVERKPEIIQNTQSRDRRIWNTLPSYELSHHVGSRRVFVSKEWSIGVQIMSNKYSTIALGTMLGLSAVAFSGASASAAAMLPLSPAVTGQTNAANEGVVQVKHKRKWKKNWNNDDYDWQYRKHRHRDGVYLSLPLIIGGAYAANRYYGDDYYDDGDYGDYEDYDDYDDGGGLSSRHVRYCLNKYQSYNPRYNTWVAYSGQVKKCYSPYM